MNFKEFLLKEDIKLSSEQQQKIKDYVINTPNLDDTDFHEYVKSLGIDPHEAEEVVYAFVRELKKNES